MAIHDELQKAIAKSGQTRYAIAKGAGVDYDALADFLDKGRDIRLSTAEKLASYLGMRLMTPPKPKRKKRP